MKERVLPFQRTPRGEKRRPKVLAGSRQMYWYEPEPRKAGVYFLVRGSSVVYIGQSTDIESRIEAQREAYNFDVAYFIEVPSDRLDDVEGAAIRFYEPEFNGRKANGKICSPPQRLPDVQVLEEFGFDLQVIAEARADIRKRWVIRRSDRSPAIKAG